MTTTFLLPILLFLGLALVSLFGLFFLNSAGILNKKLFAYSFAAIALAAGIGALLAKFSNPAYSLFIVEGLALGLGIFHIRVSRKMLLWPAEAGFWSELLLAAYAMFLLGAAFAAMFGLLTPADQSATLLTTGLLPFMIPVLVLYALEAWLAIPPKIYKKWFYPVERPVPLVELDNTLRLNFLVTKRPDAPVSDRFTVTLPADRTLDELFQFMIYSHNNEEDPEHPILYYEGNTEGTLLGWIFYRESWGGWIKTYYDPSLSLLRNGLKTDHTIIARSFSN